MAIPSFNGLFIFGLSQEMPVVPYPKRIQWDTYPDVNGRQSIDHGESGGFCEATFYQECYGVDRPTALQFLTAYEALWLNLKRAGGAYTLIDTLDRAWPKARLVDFGPTGPPRVDANAVASRTYRARFEIPDLV